MTDPTSAKTTPVRLSAKKAPVAEGVIETAPDTTSEAVRSSAGTVGATGAASGATATSGSGQPGKARTAPRPAAKPSAAIGPRRVRLSVSRVDPWSVMKLGFLLSVALGIMTVVAAAVAWNVVDSMGVFTDLESLLSDLGAIEQFRVIMEYLRLKNIMSMAVVVSIVNVALITALATLGAFLYNITAALVGGLHLTLTDD
ncbi:transmembrane protein DUF3566 [Salana multivorans]|uniref:Transmembrane protein DUF3566 n=1 Tax=Salana multivorans TaxID=120377 RepID=A0A3N2DA63_9MICO|nr:DUF3566 domain-containing protein [Salana multivorans]ROR96677.1 transmembrane protein DUF3566 [Salana multivorans]